MLLKKARMLELGRVFLTASLLGQLMLQASCDDPAAGAGATLDLTLDHQESDHTERPPEDDGALDGDTDLHATSDGQTGEHDTAGQGQLFLEYLQPYGDDGVVCQGFADSPADTEEIASCVFEMAKNEVRVFQVLVLADGQPVEGAVVRWTLQDGVDPESGEPLATLDVQSSATNASGVATVTATAAWWVGTFSIEAALEEETPATAPLLFIVTITGGGNDDLNVELQYDGTKTFDMVTVYLFERHDGVPACYTVSANSLPWPAMKSASKSSISQPFNFSGFANLSASNPTLNLTIVAVAGSGGASTPLAFACDDLQGVVEYGKSTTVKLLLKGTPPTYAGTYEFTTSIDVLSALPDELQSLVNQIVDFINGPTEGLLRLSCYLGGNSLRNLCESVFINPDDPQGTQLTVVGAVAAEVMDAFFHALLADSIAADIVFPFMPTAKFLEDLKIHGHITISSEPDSFGYISNADTLAVLETVSFLWTVGETCNPDDPQCGLKSYSLSPFGVNNITGRFNILINGYENGQFDKMVITPYSINFKTGLFLTMCIEKMVLPLVAGDGSQGLPVVDSYAEFVKVVMGGGACLVADNCCEAFVDAVVTKTDPALEPMLSAGCTALLQLAPAYFEYLLAGMDPSSGDGPVLATAEGKPCQLHDTNGDHVVDHFGLAEPASERCTWIVTLNVAGQLVSFETQFWGVRVQ